MDKPRILLGDDHVLFSEGLRRILEAQFEIVGCAENGRDVLAAAERLHPDVIVMDISMPVLNGIDTASQLQKLSPVPRIVFLTMHEDGTFVKAAFRAGALGYVLKRSAPSEITSAIQEILQGRIFLSPLVDPDVRSIVTTKRRKPTKLKSELTSRQREVLQLLAEGKAAKEISATLNVSVKTVEFHKYRLMQAVGLRSIAELTRYAVAHGIVQAY